ncbi:hypothetical protein [Parvicella tangerina]|uniref:PH domain-containing protein n=1 Tax=Parvicella tangerina TaxID=2829795 RepID=A0A916NR77_9FLAO|nr:hypothetical protein [Parvicella tangerina]CAG5080549.1 hypothetical protein CRYO30217_01369 [Parvicella tangerina]
MQSDKGFAYSKTLKLIGIGLFITFLLISIVNNPMTSTGLVLLLLGTFFLAVSLLGSLIFPDTKTIEISENGIIVFGSEQPIVIKTEEILRIANHTSFTNQSWNSVDFYKIEMKKNAVNNSPVFFKASSAESRSFVKALKTKWVKSNGPQQDIKSHKG